MRTKLIVEVALISMTLFGACRCGPGLLARPAEADWVVTPAALTLPAVYVGQRATAELTVDNLGGVSSTAPLSIDAPFRTSLSELTLGPAESRRLTIEAVPTFVGVASATLHLGALTVEVSVEGLAIAECVAPRLCTAAHFDPERGHCVLTDTPDDTACSDACVTGQCRAGVCEGTVNACDDGDLCTTDACGANGCVHVPLRCPAAGPCTAPVCDSLNGCATIEAPDGTLCGADDCRASEVDVCIRGQCVTRPRPNQGRCVNTWVPATLAGRRRHALAWDEARGRVVLFGGYGSWGIMPQTWEWNGSLWEIRTPVASPPPTYRPAMAFDLARSKTVLVAPKTDDTSELWEWDGVTWILRSSASASPATHGDPNYQSVGVAYDVARHVTLVVFFRLGQSQPIDTWEWNGTAWRQRFPATVPQLYYGAGTLTWDGTRQRVVLTGTSSDPVVASHLNAVWEWDGTDWTDRSSLAAAVDSWGTYQAAPAWDADRGELVMKGTGVTFTRNGTQWRSQPASGPEPIGGESPMVFDTARHQLVLFDGEVTWTFDGATWSKLSEEGSPRLVALVTDTVRQRVLGFDLDQPPTLALWRWAGRAWVPLPAANAPSGRIDFSVAFDTQRDRLVLFGGTVGNNTALSETWEFDGTSWAQRLPARRPPAREKASMAFDPIRQRVVLFGGTGSTELGDVWEWDGVDWQARSSVGAPSARSSVPMTWDSTGARLLLLGGPGGGAPMEAWSWNGTWADVTPATPPAAPPFVRTMAEDPVRHVVLGTESVSFNSMGTWEFSSAGWQQRTPTVSPTTSSFPMYGAAWDPVTGKVLISGVGQTWVFLP